MQRRSWNSGRFTYFSKYGRSWLFNHYRYYRAKQSGSERALLFSPEQVFAQIQALSGDMPAQAIKLGMVGNSEMMEKLAVFLHDFSGTVILDPLLYSSSGTPLFSTSDGDYLTALKSLFPRIDLLTPNIPEAESLLNSHFFL